MLGGALGAGARFLLGTRVQLWLGGAMPWGTGAVNLLGCVAIGVRVEWITAGRLSPELRVPFAVSFLGGAQGAALAYLFATTIPCLAGVASGIGLARIFAAG